MQASAPGGAASGAGAGGLLFRGRRRCSLGRRLLRGRRRGGRRGGGGAGGAACAGGCWAGACLAASCACRRARSASFSSSRRFCSATCPSRSLHPALQRRGLTVRSGRRGAGRGALGGRHQLQAAGLCCGGGGGRGRLATPGGVLTADFAGGFARRIRRSPAPHPACAAPRRSAARSCCCRRPSDSPDRWPASSCGPWRE